jgi:hypothetical protein
MSTIDRRLRLAACAAIAAPSLFAGAIAAQEASPPADAGDASAAADADAGPPLRNIERDPPVAEHTKAPTEAEWKLAPNVEIARSVTGCSARLLREWLRIDCKEMFKGIALLSGSPEGVDLGPVADPMEANGADLSAWVVLPLRRGDRRLIEFIAYRPQTKFCDSATTVIVSEQWLPTDPGPLVTASDDETSCY